MKASMKLGVMTKTVALFWVLTVLTPSFYDRLPIIDTWSMCLWFMFMLVKLLVALLCDKAMCDAYDGSAENVCLQGFKNMRLCVVISLLSDLIFFGFFIK